MPKEQQMRNKRPSGTRHGNYKVGKGRPPVATRWQPGQSGNPKSRPKGIKNIDTIFNEALEQKVEIQEKGTVRQISVREGIVRRVVNQALKGDPKAVALVLAKEPEIARKFVLSEQPSPGASAEQILATYQRMIRGVRG
jgi:hypothetical protein